MRLRITLATVMSLSACLPTPPGETPSAETPLRLEFGPATAAQDKLMRSLLADEIAEAERVEAGRGPKGGPVRLRAATADLNGDGRAEYLFQIWSQAWCAPVGCDTWGYAVSAEGRATALWPAGVNQTDAATVMPQANAGWRDLVFEDGSATGRICYRLRWDGAAYRSAGPADAASCP